MLNVWPQWCWIARTVRFGKERYACQSSVRWVRETSKFCHFCHVCHVTDSDFRMITHNRGWRWATLAAAQGKPRLISFFSSFWWQKSNKFWSNLSVNFVFCVYTFQFKINLQIEQSYGSSSPCTNWTCCPQERIGCPYVFLVWGLHMSS